MVFANVETFSSAPVSYLGFFDQGENLFEHRGRPAGVGLRFMMSRQSRTNITLDFTVAEKTFGLYFGCGRSVLSGGHQARVRRPSTMANRVRSQSLSYSVPTPTRPWNPP